MHIWFNMVMLNVHVYDDTSIKLLGWGDNHHINHICQGITTLGKVKILLFLKALLTVLHKLKNL